MSRFANAVSNIATNAVERAVQRVVENNMPMDMGPMDRWDRITNMLFDLRRGVSRVTVYANEGIEIQYNNGMVDEMFSPFGTYEDYYSSLHEEFVPTLQPYTPGFLKRKFGKENPNAVVLGQDSLRVANTTLRFTVTEFNDGEFVELKVTSTTVIN